MVCGDRGKAGGRVQYRVEAELRQDQGLVTIQAHNLEVYFVQGVTHNVITAIVNHVQVNSITSVNQPPCELSTIGPTSPNITAMNISKKYKNPHLILFYCNLVLPMLFHSFVW